MNYSIDKLNDAYNNMPPALQDFVLSDDVIDTIQLIAEEYGITGENLDTFALATMALIFFCEGVGVN